VRAQRSKHLKRTMVVGRIDNLAEGKAAAGIPAGLPWYAGA
jgi:hypothetical protein